MMTKLTSASALIFAVLVSAAANFISAPAPQPDIGVNGYFATDKALRGRVVQAAIVIDIPAGYHINSNRPLEKYLIPTQLKIDAPAQVRIGPVAYPRASLKSFKFANKQLSVYEGRAILRFNVSVPANYSGGRSEERRVGKE